MIYIIAMLLLGILVVLIAMWLKAFHFEDARHYLEVMDLNVKPEKHEDSATLEKLQSFVDNLAHRFRVYKTL